jgi:hypothetical protein
MLISPLGLPGWSARGMASGERVALEIARRTRAFGGWFLGHLATLARRSPRLFFRVVISALPDCDRRALGQPGLRDPFVASYAEAFRRGSRGVAQVATRG